MMDNGCVGWCFITSLPTLAICMKPSLFIGYTHDSWLLKCLPLLSCWQGQKSVYQKLPLHLVSGISPRLPAKVVGVQCSPSEKSRFFLFFYVSKDSPMEDPPSSTNVGRPPPKAFGSLWWWVPTPACQWESESITNPTKGGPVEVVPAGQTCAQSVRQPSVAWPWNFREK